MRGRLLCDACLGTRLASEADIDELATWPDASDRGAPRLVLLDAGITVELTDVDRRNLSFVFRSLLAGDGAAIADMLVEQGAPAQHAHVDRAAFRRDVDALVQSVLCVSEHNDTQTSRWPWQPAIQRAFSLKNVKCLSEQQRNVSAANLKAARRSAHDRRHTPSQSHSQTVHR